MPTQIPAFREPVHDAQQTFRALLTALSCPGTLQTTAALTPPPGLSQSCAAALLTLLDLETTFWLQPGHAEEVSTWVLFHTGCRLTDAPAQADFAFIHTVTQAPPLTAYRWGTPEYPEASTSLLIQCPTWRTGPTVTLQGPGIGTPRQIAPPLPLTFWQQWQEMTQSYPLGVDGWCFADQQVLGLPRTTHVTY